MNNKNNKELNNTSSRSNTQNNLDKHADKPDKIFVHGITRILVKNKSLDIDKHNINEITTAFEDQGRVAFEEFLLDESIVDKEDLLRALSEYYGMQAVDVIGEFFDHHFLRLIPKDVLLQNQAIPYRREGNLISVIVANPERPNLIFTLSQHISNDVILMVGLAEDIKESIRVFYDESITYQPYELANELMERSMMEVFPFGQQLKPVLGRRRPPIPHTWEKTIDAYES